MKKVLTKAAAVFSAAVMMSATFGSLYSFAEDEQKTEVKVSFNITDDMTAGAKTDITLFEDYTTEQVYTTIPSGVFTKKGYVFSGWTDNGIDGYISGDSYTFPEGTTEVVFEPVWYDASDTDIHNIIYSLDYKGETVERPDWLKDGTAAKGQIVTPNYTRVEAGNAYSRSLFLNGDHLLTYEKRFVMPDEDVVISYEWLEKITFTYYAGDVDRLNGKDTYSFGKIGGATTDLAGNDRFSRDGFELTGWLSDYDGEIYKTLEVIEAPPVDVTFTAVWTPKNYNIVFKQGNGGKNLKVAGATDTYITCPEPDITVDGKTFLGWKDSDGITYAPGSQYLVKGAAAGLGIMLEAVWGSEGTYESFKYKNYGDHIEITDYDETAEAADIVIPEKIEGLPVTCIQKAFFDYGNIKSIEIPESITKIYTNAFGLCPALTDINVSENNKNYSSVDGVLFNKDRTELIKYPENRTETEYIIPESVTTIGEAAFSFCNNLKSMEIPENVALIDYYAFSESADLKEVKILNPECVICEPSVPRRDDVVIYGYDGSTAWAYAEKYDYKFESLGEYSGTTTPEAVLLGDANCDGLVTIADATAIIQHLGNPDEYALSKQGEANADIVDRGDGITGIDANAIQAIEGGFLSQTDFPLSKDEYNSFMNK